VNIKINSELVQVNKLMEMMHDCNTVDMLALKRAVCGYFSSAMSFKIAANKSFFFSVVFSISSKGLEPSCSKLT
jgi:hypothetical protein